MRFESTGLEGAWLMHSEPHVDSRGQFSRIYCQKELAALGIDRAVVQVSLSYNRRRGTVRGMHFQWPPSYEDKVVRCVRGSVFDAIVDLRPHSGTYLRQFTIELTHLAVCSPSNIAGSRFAPISISDDIETASAVKSGGELVGEAFVLYKPMLS